jgi:hypothetical protein
MPQQFARPTADTHLGNYKNEAGGTTNIYQSIDETSPSDADFIESPSAPANEPYVTRLGNLSDPATSTGHLVRYRYAKDQSGGAQVNLTVELRQGYVSEASPGTLIASWSHSNISETWTTAVQTLTGSQADSITDYTSLYLRFVFNQP